MGGKMIHISGHKSEGKDWQQHPEKWRQGDFGGQRRDPPQSSNTSQGGHYSSANMAFGNPFRLGRSLAWFFARLKIMGKVADFGLG